MRILTAICLLLTSSAFASPIPAREPFFGEPRPNWWWDIWYGRVVVLEGKITFKKSEKPDISIKFNEERMKDVIPDDKTRELQSKVCDFYVGELEILKFHYADGGASALDGQLKQMGKGGLKRLKVLIPIMRFGDHTTLYGMNLQPDVANIGIHVFDYSNLILGLHLVYRDKIPNESLGDAQEVFKLRGKQVFKGVKGLDKLTTRVVIPRIDYEQAPGVEVLEFIRSKVWSINSLDGAAPRPAHEYRCSPDRLLKQITFRRQNVSYEDALTEICQELGITWAIERGTITISDVNATDLKKSEQAVPSDGHKPSSRAPSDGPTAPADAH